MQSAKEEFKQSYWKWTCQNFGGQLQSAKEEFKHQKKKGGDKNEKGCNLPKRNLNPVGISTSSYLLVVELQSAKEEFKQIFYRVNDLWIYIVAICQRGI